MHEYRFEVERPVPDGRVVLDVRNAGGVDHEMTLVKLPEDFPPIADQARGGPARNAPTVASLRRRPGAVTTLAVDLSEGRYGVVCFVVDPDGVQHYRKGMAAEFTVD